MKISMLMSVYGQHAIGGAERTAEQIGRGLARRGHQVSMVSLGGGLAGDSRVLQDGLVHHSIPLAQFYDPYGLDGSSVAKSRPSFQKALWHGLDVYNPIMGRRLLNLWRAESPQLVITHTLQGFSVAAWHAARNAGAMVVHVVHDHSLVCPGTAMTKGTVTCETLCKQCAFYGVARQAVSVIPDAVVGPSQVILNRHRTFGWFSGVHDQRVIENAVSGVWPPARTAAAAGSSQVLRFGYLGRLDESKGVDVLLSAVTHLPRTGWTLALAGGGNDSSVRDFIAAHDLGMFVKLLGIVESASFLQSIDVLVMPSRAHETFCNAVMEAGCLGIPSIVSDRGALPERVGHGAAGWIVPAGESAPISAAMRHCMAEPQEVARLGTVAAANRYRYEEARQIDAWSSLCNDMLSKHQLE